jgi:hypothetical protein
MDGYRSKNMMNRIIGIVVIVACIAAQGDQPKAIKGSKSILLALPAGVLPNAGDRSLDALHEKLINDWLKGNIDGKKLDGKFLFGHGDTPKDGMIRVGMNERGYSTGRFVVIQSDVAASCTEDQLDTIKKLGHEEEVHATGTIKSARISHNGAPNPNRNKAPALQISVEVILESDAKVTR